MTTVAPHDERAFTIKTITAAACKLNQRNVQCSVFKSVTVTAVWNQLMQFLWTALTRFGFVSSAAWVHGQREEHRRRGLGSGSQASQHTLPLLWAGDHRRWGKMLHRPGAGTQGKKHLVAVVTIGTWLSVAKENMVSPLVHLDGPLPHMKCSLSLFPGWVMDDRKRNS